MRLSHPCSHALLFLLLLSGAGIDGRAQNAAVQSQIASIVGRVIDSVGAMPGVLVRVRPSRPDTATQAYEAITEADGEFEFPNLSPGNYVVQVVAPGSETATERRVDATEARTTSVDIEVYRGCDTLADELGSLTKADASKAMRMALEDALASELAAGQDVHVFSTANVPHDFDVSTALPKRFELLTPEVLRERAERVGEVWFYAIKTVRVHGGCIAVAICQGLERRKGAPAAVLLGGGDLMNEYRRTPTGWQKKRVYFWQR
jgi:hypothetical protein